MSGFVLGKNHECDANWDWLLSFESSNLMVLLLLYVYYYPFAGHILFERLLVTLKCMLKVALATETNHFYFKTLNFHANNYWFRSPSQNFLDTQTTTYE